MTKCSKIESISETYEESERGGYCLREGKVKEKMYAESDPGERGKHTCFNGTCPR